MKRVELYQGDALAVLEDMAAACVDTIITDPPYGLSFMGKGWDHGVPGPTFWRAALRVLKPGGFLFAFGGTRTYHRLAVAIEDGGFEIRDQVMWLYGTGFPKNLAIDKAIDRATYKDPESGEYVQSRKPRSGVYQVTALIRRMRDRAGLSNSQIDAAFGFRGMAGHWTSDKSQPAVPKPDQWEQLKALCGVDGSDVDPETGKAYDELVWEQIGLKGSNAPTAMQDREVVGHKRGKDCVNGDTFRPGEGEYVPKVYELTAPATDQARAWHGWGTALKPAWEPVLVAMKPTDGNFAQNAIEHGVAGLNIDACRLPMSDGDRERIANMGGFGREGYERTPGEALHLNKTPMPCRDSAPHEAGRWPTNVILDEYAAGFLDGQSVRVDREGLVDGVEAAGPSRFLYAPKASRVERDAGVTSPAKLSRRYGEQGQGPRPQQTPRRDTPQRNTHPTVKPVAVMEWLCRLSQTPTGGVVLDPFMGSGSTGVAAVRTGRDFVGIDKEAEYVEIARQRINHAEPDVIELDGQPVELERPRQVAGAPNQLSLFGGGA